MRLQDESERLLNGLLAENPNILQDIKENSIAKRRDVLEYRGIGGEELAKDLAAYAQRMDEAINKFKETEQIEANNELRSYLADSLNEAQKPENKENASAVFLDEIESLIKDNHTSYLNERRAYGEQRKGILARLETELGFSQIPTEKATVEKSIELAQRNNWDEVIKRRTNELKKLQEQQQLWEEPYVNKIEQNIQKPGDLAFISRKYKEVVLLTMIKDPRTQEIFLQTQGIKQEGRENSAQASINNRESLTEHTAAIEAGKRAELAEKRSGAGASNLESSPFERKSPTTDEREKS